MANKLIIENGGTKSVWTLLVPEKPAISHRKAGMHPLLSADAELQEWCSSYIAKQPELPDRIYFYSTGASVPVVNLRIGQIFGEAFHLNPTHIEVATDLLASARATCQHEHGISCILGTGSNAGLYDGKNIVQRAGGLGYVLGDEGSGAHLGKNLLMDYLRGDLPEAVRKTLEAETACSPEEVIRSIYKKPFANQYLASFAPFIIGRQEQEYFRQLIKSSLSAFLEYTVKRFPGHGQLPVHFTGSVAWYLRPLIEEVCRENLLPAGEFQKDSVEGLIRYHG